MGLTSLAAEMVTNPVGQFWPSISSSQQSSEINIGGVPRVVMGDSQISELTRGGLELGWRGFLLITGGFLIGFLGVVFPVHFSHIGSCSYRTLLRNLI